MKLYTKPGACSTADHIALQWTGGPFEVEILSREAMKAPEYLAINPTGTVPAIVDGDFVLTQNAAIMGYIADTFPAAGLGGDGSARQRAEAARWLSFVNSDLHPAFTRCSTRAPSTPTKASTTRSRPPRASACAACLNVPMHSLPDGNGWPASAASRTRTCTSPCAGRRGSVST